MSRCPSCPRKKRRRRSSSRTKTRPPRVPSLHAPSPHARLPPPPRRCLQGRKTPSVGRIAGGDVAAGAATAAVVVTAGTARAAELATAGERSRREQVLSHDSHRL